MELQLRALNFYFLQTATPAFRVRWYYITFFYRVCLEQSRLRSLFVSIFRIHSVSRCQIVHFLIYLAFSERGTKLSRLMGVSNIMVTLVFPQIIQTTFQQFRPIWKRRRSKMWCNIVVVKVLSFHKQPIELTTSFRLFLR